ncbi:MAG: hypothetical protein OXC67_04900 [Flavobacteriaceae bacterium]|nr:hypothetical protein [Flavobacteriaceae bacterium]
MKTTLQDFQDFLQVGTICQLLSGDGKEFTCSEILEVQQTGSRWDLIYINCDDDDEEQIQWKASIEYIDDETILYFPFGIMRTIDLLPKHWKSVQKYNNNLKNLAK